MSYKFKSLFSRYPRPFSSCCYYFENQYDSTITGNFNKYLKDFNIHVFQMWSFGIQKINNKQYLEIYVHTANHSHSVKMGSDYWNERNNGVYLDIYVLQCLDWNKPVETIGEGKLTIQDIDYGHYDEKSGTYVFSLDGTMLVDLEKLQMGGAEMFFGI